MTTVKPDHVPRDYSPRRGRPSCALEEDLWELGINARLRLVEPELERILRRRAKEVYDARGGLVLAYSGLRGESWDDS